MVRVGSIVGAIAVATLAIASASGECSSAYPRQNDYSVSVTERAAAPGGAALISRANGSSDFNFAFTTAWFPDAEGDGLIVRVVECSPNHENCTGVPHPQWSNAGALCVVRASLGASGPLTAERVTNENVSWMGAVGPPQSNAAEWGFADPRAALGV